MMPDFQGLFTPAGAIAFVTGLIVRRIWCLAKNKYLDRVDPENAPHRDFAKATILAWGVILAAVTYIGVQAQTTYTATVSLVTRTSWDQYYATKERCALTNWLTLATSPPLNIAKLHTTDQEYQTWAQDITRDYLKKIDEISDQRQKTVNHPPNRLAPLNEPRCEP